MICLLAIAAITLFSVALLIRRCRHPKLMVHAENPYHESTDDGISTSLFTSTDPWKFPEHKLTIFHDRVLGKWDALWCGWSLLFLHIGKGAFGKVLLARAAGIIPEYLDKDIVAVKTAKGNYFLKSLFILLIEALNVFFKISFMWCIRLYFSVRKKWSLWWAGTDEKIKASREHNKSPWLLHYERLVTHQAWHPVPPLTSIPFHYLLPCHSFPFFRWSTLPHHWVRHAWEPEGLFKVLQRGSA